jgi:subtilisin family serine protease
MLSRFHIVHDEEPLHTAQQRAAHSGRILAIHPSGRVCIAPYVPAGWDLLSIGMSTKNKNDIPARTGRTATTA